jgi:hypothetical protein
MNQLSSMGRADSSKLQLPLQLASLNLPCRFEQSPTSP